MKKLFTLVTFSFCFLAANSQSVSVNTDGSSADASAMLDIKSANKGILVPRMTTVQRPAIVTPANGLLVYDTDVKSFWYYNGASWTNIAGAGGGGNFALPFDATVNTPGTAFRIANGTTAIEGSSTGGAGVYGYSENGSGVNASSANSFGVLASSSQATAIRAFSSNTNPTIYATNSNATGVAISGSSSLHDGILGTSAGTLKAGIYGTSTAANGYGVRGFSAEGTGVSGASTNGYAMNAFSNNGIGLRTSSTTGTALEVFGKLKIYGAAVNPQNGAVLTSDAVGNATWKLNRVAFQARGNGTIGDITNQDLVLTTEEYDYSNSYNPATGIFTVPVTGVYSFGAQIQYALENDLDDNIDLATITIRVSRGGGTVTSISSPYGTKDNDQHYSHARALAVSDIRLLAGDIVIIGGLQVNSAQATLPWSARFYGHLVFAE